LLSLSLTLPALSVELFRYQGTARGGGTLEYIFATDGQPGANAVTKEKASEIAADFMTNFYLSKLAHWRFRSLAKSRYRSGWCASPTLSKDH
jgi:hypothetical protein